MKLVRHGFLLGMALGWVTAGCSPSTPQGNIKPTTVRVAVIGGMTETGFWPELAKRFERATGHHVGVVATGPKQALADAFRLGLADLITMHASDTIINLVADGYATDAQPWLKNDLVIVGPADDPAGIQGMTDAVAALKKIAGAGTPFVVHASLGAQDVLRDLLTAGDTRLDEKNVTMLLEDKNRRVLEIAADKHAYTLVGRIPFLSGKMPNKGLVLMVRGDPRLRRPYMVAVANPQRISGARVEAARQLAEFLRKESTQQWIAEFGRGKLDPEPLFFRVAGGGS